MRALVLAAVPSAETKYLRRWASDAGVQLDSRIALAPSLVQGDAPRIDAVLLAQLDLLIVDERSWPTLRAQRDELRSAIADGLGLLLRVTGPLSDAVLTDWRALGLPLQVTDGDPRTLYPDDGFDNADREPLHAWPLRAESSQVVPIWRDTDGNALAVRQSTGQGRVGAVWLSDSHALSTRGERERHASLWAQLFAELARARAAPAARLPAQPVVGRRATVCANAPALRVLTSDAQSIALPLLPGESIDERCAAFWPRTPGWHRLQSPEDEAAPENTVDAPFYVHDTDALDSLVAEADREATRQLVNRTEPPSARSTDREDWRRLAVLAWLVLMVVSWWMERRAQRAQ